MMWNYFLVEEMYEILARKKWVLPVIHGFVDFVNFEDSGNKFTCVLLARRSRHYAGTRYLKRGINTDGRPANFVEIEQVFYRHSPCHNDTAPAMTSFVQIRGSIPFFWCQIPNPLTMRPDIIIEKQKDINAVSTRRHFARLFEKYSFPLICLNLTKANNVREETVASEYRIFVRNQLNKELPKPLNVTFIHWDMKDKKKNKRKPYQYDLLEHAEKMCG